MRARPRIVITRAAMASYVVQTESPVVKRKCSQLLYLRPYPSQLLYTDTFIWIQGYPRDIPELYRTDHFGCLFVEKCALFCPMLAFGTRK